MCVLHMMWVSTIKALTIIDFEKGKIMTDTMKAIVLAKFGGFDAFEMRDATVPVVGPRQVRVRVHATAINPLDYQIRRGDYAD